MKKFSLCAQLEILKKTGGSYAPLTKDELTYASSGGYCFVVGGKDIQFDWDASASSFKDDDSTIIEVETGYGFAFNDFELAEYYDDEYAKMGLSREDITPELLASAEGIREFHITIDVDDEEDISVGWCEDNADDDAKYHVRLICVGLNDRDTANNYPISNDVIEHFNNGIV